MKKTIAAILVTILASAGYVVLDKASADKIDLMASQISSQQAVINRLETAAYYAGTTETDSTQPTGYIMPNDPLEMQTGCTLRCYPDEGRIVRAYVIDPLITTTTTTLPAATTKPFQPAVEVTTVPQTTEGVVAADESAIPVHGNELESNTVSMSNVPSTNATTITNVQITSFGCIMLDKSLTGVPMFSVYFSGIADRSFAGRQIMVYFGDSQINVMQATTTILPDGSFSVSKVFVLANASIVPLNMICIS